jgi:hypothetical protein
MSGWREWGSEMSGWREGDKGFLVGGERIRHVWLERGGSGCLACVGGQGRVRGKEV